MKRIVSRHRLIVTGLLAAAFLSVAVAAVRAAVTLMSFTAAPEGNAIAVRWQTGSELDAAGFIVLGSTDQAIYDPVGDFVPATGNASGASYVVTDTDVERGVTYYYILDVYDTSNNLEEAGPISATLPFTSTYAVDMAPVLLSQVGQVGYTLTYTLRITNAGNISSTFALTAANYSWPTIISPVLAGPLSAGAGSEVKVMVAIPFSGRTSVTDTALVTATAQGGNFPSAMARLITLIAPYQVFLPVVFKP